jgi:hypothetical protein
MLCPKKCHRAVDSLDPKWMSKSWNDGVLETWRCPECGYCFVTKMIEGVRRDEGILYIKEESPL